MKRGTIVGMFVGVVALATFQACCPPVKHFDINDGRFVMSDDDISMAPAIDHVDLELDEDEARFTIVRVNGDALELSYKRVSDDE